MTDTTLAHIAELDAALAPLLAERDALQREYLMAHGWRQPGPCCAWYSGVGQGTRAYSLADAWGREMVLRESMKEKA